MRKLLKVLLLSSVLVLSFTSCEKACICTNLDNGASDILWGVYSKKDCETYTDYYQGVYGGDNVDCSYKIKK